MTVVTAARHLRPSARQRRLNVRRQQQRLHLQRARAVVLMTWMMTFRFRRVRYLETSVSPPKARNSGLFYFQLHCANIQSRNARTSGAWARDSG